MSKGHCDGCDKDRSDVRSCGQDANGDADAPDLCFVCRKEASRGRFYDRKQGRYVRCGYSYHEVRGEVKVWCEDQMHQTDGRILKREVRDCVQHLSPHLAPKLQREMVDDLWGILSR